VCAGRKEKLTGSTSITATSTIESNTSSASRRDCAVRNRNAVIGGFSRASLTSNRNISSAGIEGGIGDKNSDGICRCPYAGEFNGLLPPPKMMLPPLELMVAVVMAIAPCTTAIYICIQGDTAAVSGDIFVNKYAVISLQSQGSIIRPRNRCADCNIT
jgi:hypothetical protein